MKTCEITIYLKQETEGNPLGCVILKDVSKYRLTHDSIYEFYTPSDSEHEYCMMEIPRENVNYIRRLEY